MTFLNRLLNPIFDLLLRPLQPLGILASLALLSLVTAIAILLVVRATSDQRALAAIKRQIHADLFEIRLFNDDLRAMLRAELDILRHNATYLRLSLVPMVWMLVQRRWRLRSFSRITATPAWTSASPVSRHGPNSNRAQNHPPLGRAGRRSGWKPPAISLPGTQSSGLADRRHRAGRLRAAGADCGRRLCEDGPRVRRSCATFARPACAAAARRSRVSVRDAVARRRPDLDDSRRLSAAWRFRCSAGGSTGW